ncbi:MAG TPA: hypothetical protein VK508_09795 [Cyclobacteriaceae bacterium]|nr:hypothetical protein [Cyclobacteriaceae bacterium]
MKKIALMVALLTVCAGAYAQKYWVVETESKTARVSIVKIYDTSNNLLSETKIDRLIDINKKKERRRLNRMVRQSSALLWSKR